MQNEYRKTRPGGDILLGVANDGVVKGVDPSKVETLKANLVNLSNNAQKLDPPFILFPLVHEIDGKTIIHIQVPASSQVHKTGNGSGILNVNKCLPAYSPGKMPQFIEGSSFKTIIPLDEKMITKFTVSDGTVSDRVSDRGFVFLQP